MATRKTLAPLILCAAAVAVMVAALIVTMVMDASIRPVGKSAEELLRVVEQLDSVSSVRTILFTYSQQYSVTEANLQRALDAALGFLMLGTVLVVILAVALLRQLRKVAALRHELARLRQRGSP